MQTVRTPLTSNLQGKRKGSQDDERTVAGTLPYCSQIRWVYELNGIVLQDFQAFVAGLPRFAVCKIKSWNLHQIPR